MYGGGVNRPSNYNFSGFNFSFLLPDLGGAPGLLMARTFAIWRIALMISE